jgi:hypothetical protein
MKAITATKRRRRRTAARRRRRSQFAKESFLFLKVDFN